MQEEFWEKRKAELERKIRELKIRLPAHLVPAAMLMELEDLEEERDSLEKGPNGRDQ